MLKNRHKTVNNSTNLPQTRHKMTKKKLQQRQVTGPPPVCALGPESRFLKSVFISCILH